MEDGIHSRYLRGLEQKCQSKKVKNLKPNKSPALGGLIPEFCQVFWKDLKGPYMNMINESFSNGILPETAHKSVVALIFKKGDRKLLTNYRPICVNHYDYKILSFVLANRLQKVIHKLITHFKRDI